ncbi:uncharacterized protein DS421_3g79140 [Arachis hypogaea]|nr:uncharacterized protein DS421_3g79140 [Arachis hypogaea]
MLSAVTVAALELAVELLHGVVPSMDPQACVTADPFTSRRRWDRIAKRERHTKRSPRPALSPSAPRVAVTILASFHRIAVTAPPLLHSAAGASRQAAAGGGRPTNFVSAYGFWNLRKCQCRCCLLGSGSLLPLESRTGKERWPFSVVIGAAIGRLKPLLIMILISGYWSDLFLRINPFTCFVLLLLW